VLRADALARAAPQLHEDMAKREAVVLASKLKDAEAEGQCWMLARAEQAMEALAAEVAEAEAMNGILKDTAKRQTELRMRLRLLAEREPTRWSLNEMRTVLKVGGVSFNDVEGKEALQKLTRALARAAQEHWDTEEIRAAEEQAAALAASYEAEEVWEEEQDGDEQTDDAFEDSRSRHGESRSLLPTGAGSGMQHEASTKNLSALQRARKASLAARQASAKATATKLKTWTGSTKNQLALMRARAHREKAVKSRAVQLADSSDC